MNDRWQHAAWEGLKAAGSSQHDSDSMTAQQEGSESITVPKNQLAARPAGSGPSWA